MWSTLKLLWYGGLSWEKRFRVRLYLTYSFFIAGESHLVTKTIWKHLLNKETFGLESRSAFKSHILKSCSSTWPFHGSGLTACCIRLISCHLIITCSCYLLSVICRPVIHLSLCSCGAVVPKVLQKKGFIIAVRAVRVTESDQRSWEATVLWWISIFKDGLGRGGKWEAAGGSFLSLTHFVHIKRHRALKPSSYVWTGKLAACPPVCIHVLILLPLLSQIYWASTVGCVCVSDLSSVYEHIAQPGMQGPVQIRFHNWTPEDSGASFSAARDTCSYPPTCLTWITRIRVWIPLIDIWKTFWGAAVVNPPVAL